MEISTLASFYNFLFILALVGLVVFVALYFVDAGYGKMRTEKWGPAINNKVGWCLMEMPVFVVMLYLWALSDVKFELPYLLFFLIFFGPPAQHGIFVKVSEYVSVIHSGVAQIRTSV